MKILQKICARSGCDPIAALDMHPEYVKAILRPLGMLEHPIVLISDGQDFMFEFRVRFTDELLTPTERVLAEVTNASGFSAFSVRVTDRVIKFYVDGSLVGDGPKVNLNTWTHIVVNKRGSVWNLYQNGLKTGVRVYNIPSQTDNAFKAVLRSNVEDQPIFDAIRMCVGGAVYNDAFDSPVTEPTVLTSDPGLGGRVVFLANADNGLAGTRPATDDLGNSLSYNATASASSSPNSGHTVEAGGKFSQGWFPDDPGAGEFPIFPNSCFFSDPGLYSLNSRACSNMCLEAWVKKNSQSVTDYVYIGFDSFGPTTTGVSINFGFAAYYSSSTPFITLYKGNASSTNFDVTGTDLEVWNHIACVVEDGIGKVYLNGTFVGDWGSTPFTSTSSGKGKVVVQSLGVNQSDMGVVDGVRYTLGSPVYSANFSLPTSAPTTSIP